MTEQRETCAECGFDSDLYNRADTISSQRVIAPVLASAAEGLDPSVLAARPDETTWSIVEYIDHVREVAFGNRLAIEVALQTPGRDLGEPPEPSFDPESKHLDLAPASDGAAAEFEFLRELLSSLDDGRWEQGVTVGGAHRTIDWFARHVLHDGLHHLGDVGRVRHRLGHGARRQVGGVVGLHRSGGGVPKRPAESVRIDGSGVDGDVQADRRHHGRPLQAVSLWSDDVIGELRAEGHPISPGAAGENITVTGVEWPELRPGARIDVGSVGLLISAYAIPCAKNAQWFSDRDFSRILHDRHPGSSRLYAIPLNEGTVSVGDPVTVEP